MRDVAIIGVGMNKKWGELYVKDVISKDVYRGMATDNHQATVTNLMVAHEKLDEQTAYNIVKAIFENREELIRVHKEAANFVLEKQKTAATGGIPWHPGALKYYKEKGVKLD